MRWGWLKQAFSRRIRGLVSTAEPTRSRDRHREAGVWQRRFWEHRIRDEADFTAHCDYIHYNPVNHGWVTAPSEWPYSSFHRLVRAGVYPQDWGGPVGGDLSGIGSE